MAMSEYRKIIVSICNPKSDPEQGLLNAHFEILEDGTIDEINKSTPFCESKQIFVPKGYSKLEAKYGELFFLVRCWESRFKEGDCKYVTVHEIETPDNNSKLPHGLVAELFIYDEDYIDLHTNLIRSSYQMLTPFGYVYSKDQGILGLLKFDLTNPNDTKSKGYCYEAKGIELVPKNLFKGNVKDYHTLQFEGMTLNDENIKKVRVHGVYHFVVINHHQLEERFSPVKVDAIPLNLLIKKGADALSKVTRVKGLNRQNINLLLKNTDEIKNLIKDVNRRGMLTNLLTVMKTDGIGYKDEIIESVLQTSEGQEFVTRYLDNNRDEILKGASVSINREINELKNNQKNKEIQIREELRELESQLKQKERELSLKQQEIEKEVIDDEAFQAALEKNNQELKDKKDEINQANEQLENIKSEYKIFEDIKLRKEKIEELKKEAEKQKVKAEIMQDTLKDAKKDFTDNATMWRKEIFKAREILEVLSENNECSEVELSQYIVECESNELSDTGDIIDERDSLINTMVERFSEIGRQVTVETVTNLLISIAQSQFVIFSGMPGSGKTSMALHLQTILGIESCSLTVPVFKGWTSPKDILGYYNTLTSRYNQGATELYPLLSEVSRINRNNIDNNQAMSLILLDEFNLSQPEHYLSSFIEMSDVASKRILHTGDPTNLKVHVPNYIRFICTANNDDTVLPLSPRMLDRSSVISFNQELMESSITTFKDDSEIEKYKPLISGESFIKLFTVCEGVDFVSEEASDYLTRLYEILSSDSMGGAPTYISYRKRQNILNYISVAQNSIDEDLAIDFAVMQHIIPLLRGEGEGYAARLEELSQHTSRLPQSRLMIERILSAGNENYGTYGYMI